MATNSRDEVEGARTQSVFRVVNEGIEEINDERDVHEGELVCECSHPGCVETIALSRDEYERVRRVPTHFLIVPGHEKPEIERVVEDTHRYVVVEKHGEAGEAAVRLDPRLETTDPRHKPLRLSTASRTRPGEVWQRLLRGKPVAPTFLLRGRQAYPEDEPPPRRR